ncbi:hypothetical protein [Shinella zoogloeoides]|uniref:hypothetical protein n=1 Tax=Shinella zoogloeoides TaxID=352475 RepID=UPI00299EFDCE|nr:hypothetical protein [Shinella zoogloeoides]WPE19937.1 hypothetical protein ShzoTeo12_11150 [Shinella zoogloeoides]
MTYQTCRGCVHGAGFCQARENIKAKVKGLGITSIKWKCVWRRPVYLPGDAVWARLFIQYEEQGHPYGIEEPVFGDFPATVIKMLGSKVLLFVEPQAPDSSEEYVFEPNKGGNGHVKIPIGRTRLRDAGREPICPGCSWLTRLKGHEEYCRFTPKDLIA